MVGRSTRGEEGKGKPSIGGKKYDDVHCSEKKIREIHAAGDGKEGVYIWLMEKGGGATRTIP